MEWVTVMVQKKQILFTEQSPVCLFYGMSLLPFIIVSSDLDSTWERGRGLCRVN